MSQSSRHGLGSTSLLAVALALAAACSKNEAAPGCPAASAADGGPSASLDLAWTPDGKVLHALFSQPVSPNAACFSLLADDKAATSTPQTATVEGNQVTVTLDAPLPTGPAYKLVVKNTTAADKDRVDLKGQLSLAMIWHQHQPSYVEPQGDYLRGPWVRKHATKDYYDMAAMLGGYPDVHVMVNLTPILLMQLEDYYIARLKPYVNVAAGTIDTAGYFAQRGSATTPVTDPWIDLLLTDTPEPAALTAQQKGWFYADIWSNFSISDVMIGRFPAFKDLRTKRDATTNPSFTKDELLQMKAWYQLAWFDPDFLRGPVTLPDGSVVDLSSYVAEQADGTFTLKKAGFTEADCRKLVVEEYKVLANVVGAHKKLIYDATAKTGQIEVMTTPFFHPILPLIADTDLAKEAMPTTPLPVNRYQQLEDARWHVAQAARTFQLRFGKPATGMWPGEGSVAQKVVGLFTEQGVKWIATDKKVLARSTPADQPNTGPYKVVSDTDATQELAMVFRDTAISDKLGFQYQGSTPADNVTDFITSLRKQAPAYGKEVLLSIILDGENAWEWYSKDNDAKGFLKGMYAELTAAQQRGEVRTVTLSEYLSGNAARGVAAHPVSGLPKLTHLYAASWINGNFDTWIGEEEENLGWDYLYKTRQDLTSFGLARPALDAAPAVGTPAWHAWKAWMAMYAAEGSDWFWWYGDDQTASGGDAPFDNIFRATLQSVYRHAQEAGVSTTIPDFAPILRYCAGAAKVMSANPTIDGQFSPDDGGDASKANEWTQAGSGACMDVDSGSTANPDDVIKNFYQGVSASAVNVAVRLSAGAAARLGTSWKLRLYFSQKHLKTLSPLVVEQDPFLATTRAGQALTMQAGGAAREVTIDVNGTSTAASLAIASGSAWPAPAAAPTILAAKGTDVIEVSVPYAAAHFVDGDPLEVVIVAEAAGAEVDRAPNANSVVMRVDQSKLVEVTFILDATGSKLALNAVKPIDNPVPPAGTGKVFIVGAGPELANWTPNTIQMFDDGTNGDATAGDNMWTYKISVPPGTSVQYKYTIGSAGQGWGPTEEYPLTNRAFEVKDTNADGKMVVSDVFADRPEPSGTLPPLTRILNP